MRYGLLGEKLGHSLSPAIHQSLAGLNYQLKELSPEDFDTFMKARDFLGVNVTIPYKGRALAFCDEQSPMVRRTGAANTVVNRGGVLAAYNTDYDGLRYMLQRHEVPVAGETALVLGSGGAGQTAMAVLEDLGAAGVHLVSRTPRAGQLPYEATLKRQDTGILLNATPVGMFPANGQAPIGLAAFPRLRYVVDLIYNPLQTALLLAARRRGIPVLGGLEMLVAQARCADEHFAGRSLPEQSIRETYDKMLQKHANIVLIGMPGAGKTRYGKALAATLDRPFVDMDAELERRQSCRIAEMFARSGEEAFRGWESELARELGRGNGHVISTGGGTILRPENVDALRQNGMLLWLRRPVEALALSADRPLAKSREDLERLYRQREAFYQEAADEVLDLSGDCQSDLDEIKKYFIAWIQK